MLNKMSKANQKAEELINRYRLLLQDTDTDISDEILLTSVSKDCANICVDEAYNLMSVYERENSLGYLTKVKEAIEKY